MDKDGTYLFLGLKKKSCLITISDRAYFYGPEKKVGSGASLIAIFQLPSDVENTCHYADFDNQRNL